MRSTMKAILLAAVLGLCIPAQSRAEGYVDPWAGLNFGNDDAAAGFKSFGVAFGDMGQRLVGTETNIGFTSNFFGNAVKNYVFDISGGVTVGPSIQGLRTRAHPYLAAGLASIRTSINGTNGTAKTTRNEVGLSVGGGLMLDFNSNIGLRGDVRYYRGFKGDSPVNSLGADLAHFHYWRAAVGVVFW